MLFRSGIALAATLTDMPKRPLHMVCGMLNTKDITAYLRPLAPLVETLHGVSIPGQAATVPADQTVTAARKVGMQAQIAETVADAVADIAAADPKARILISGSLYLAGDVLRENG